MTASPNIPAASARTESIKFTAPEKERLHTAQAELARLDGKLAEIADLKVTIQAIADDYAAGKVELVHAAAILCASTEDRQALVQALKPPVKRAMRDVVASVADLITKARQHHLDELQKLAVVVEKGERETQVQLGMASNDFQPSPALAGLREQYRRSLVTLNHPPSRAELNNLTSPSAPKTEPKVEAPELEREPGLAAVVSSADRRKATAA